MTVPISRRALLLGLGGGLAATSIVWNLGGCNLWQDGRRPNARAVASDRHVDYQGWMLTVEDKAKLLAAATFRRLDNTNLAGQDIGNQPVADVSACALWCLMESRCQSFAFLKPDPRESGRPSMCWIKSSVPDALPTDRFISGIVDR
jgi:hypothetical protein